MMMRRTLIGIGAAAVSLLAATPALLLLVQPAGERTPKFA
jgi:hypothetical protein